METVTDISTGWIKAAIQDFISTSPSNSMENKGQDPAWDDALVGFASGTAPIWQQYKEYIGAFHWTPWEVFNQHCPGEQAAPQRPDRDILGASPAGDGAQGQPKEQKIPSRGMGPHQGLRRIF